MHPIRAINSYLRALPRLIALQVMGSALLGAMLYALGLVADWALYTQGRVAVTTGDFAFLFTSWQGILLIVLGLLTLYSYLAVDLNVMVAFAGHWLRGEDVSLHSVILEGLAATKRYLCPEGALIVLYIALIAPIAGVGVSISLTDRLYIPTFITSVIETTPLYSALYLIAMIVFVLVGFFGSFIIYGVVIDNLSVREARKQSTRLAREHWLHYIVQSLLFVVAVALLALAIFAAYVIIVAILGVLLQPTGDAARFLMLFGVLAGAVTLGLVTGLLTPLTVMRTTALYHTYTTGLPVAYEPHPRHRNPLMIVGCIAVVLLIALASGFYTKSFDTFFPKGSDVQIIAHRACGSEGVENTAAGLVVAGDIGAAGGEIDIQRTSDGAYVVNHDNTFKRVAGDSRKPSEMTLAEVRALTVANASDPSKPGEPVSTYEEMLDASRDRLVLFVELKGETADHQMADDAVRIARERGMLDQCVFISLDYELVDYLEKTYPDVYTGFLLFASYGNTAALNCDYLALEEEAATSSAIEAIHAQGKKALVWTVNEPEEQRHFLCSDADAIITDEITQAKEIQAELLERSDLQRVVDRVSLEV